MSGNPIIIYVPNGHTYDVYQQPTAQEARLFNSKLEQLANNESNRAPLERNQKILEERVNVPNPNTRHLWELQNCTETLLGMESSRRQLLAELEGMLQMALQNCLHLTPGQINELDINERIGIFKELVKMSR